VPRSLDAFAFIGRQFNPPKWIDDTVLRFRAEADQNKKARALTFGAKVDVRAAIRRVL
jgi:hypothetical protein